MALNRPTMARVSGTDDKPVTFKVVGSPCQLRPGPNFDYFSIGVIRKGNDVKGFPFVLAGVSWIRLADDEAAVYVPDPARREDGVWLPQVHPKYGRLVQSKEEDVRYGGSEKNVGNENGSKVCTPVPKEGGKGFGRTVTLKIAKAYEEMLQAEWEIDRTSPGDDEPIALQYTSGRIEMVIDLASGRPRPSGDDPLLSLEKGGNGKVTLKPAKGAIVKRVEVGPDTKITLGNMPDSRYFLISVVATFDDRHELRSRWVRAATLHVEGRDQSLGSTDPGGNVRGKCEGKNCACAEFVPMGSWNLNSDPLVHCRRCGCPNDWHVIVGRADEVGKRAAQIKQEAGEEETVELPREAKDWDERERNLWHWSNGALHPRQHPAAARKRPARTVTGNIGRVSVVCPTMEDRQVFHEQVWSCFLNQTWPDKELIIIETYQTRSSDVFRNINDDRLVYLRFRCGQTTELSIGAKRNIAQHIASGDYIANFDDDDIYAPTYLSTMVHSLNAQSAAFITLSNWYFFDIKSGRFGFFDPLEYAKVKKMRDKDIQGWLWGYGFSYLHKLQPALDNKIDYRDQNMEEDIHYINFWKETFGKEQVVLHDDTIGIVSHTLHGRNTSNSFALREVPREEMWDTDVAELPGCLSFYLGMFPRQEERSRFIEYEADSEKVTRRTVQRHVQWLHGTFRLESNRGATGGDIRFLCAQHLRLPYEALRVHRGAPEGGFVDLRQAEEPAPKEPEVLPTTSEVKEEPQPPWWAPLAGTWVYGSKEYTLTGKGEELHFEGPHSRVGTVHGAFAFTGHWLQVELLSPAGEKVGLLRLRYIQEADKTVTNFRSLTREDWGKDIPANRKVDDEGESKKANEPPPAPVQLPPSTQMNAPVQDGERLGAFVKEIWLVITSQDVLKEVLQKAQPTLPADAFLPKAPVKDKEDVQLVSVSTPQTAKQEPQELKAEVVTEKEEEQEDEAEDVKDAPQPAAVSQTTQPEVHEEPQDFMQAYQPWLNEMEARLQAAAEVEAAVESSPATPDQPSDQEVPPEPPVAEAKATAAEAPVVEAPVAEAPVEEVPTADPLKMAEAPAEVSAVVEETRTGETPVAETPLAQALAASLLPQEPVEELNVVVHIDQALNLRETFVLPAGTTIGEVKELLVHRDLLGLAKASDIQLAWEPEPDDELSSTFQLKADITEFIIM